MIEVHAPNEPEINFDRYCCSIIIQLNNYNYYYYSIRMNGFFLDHYYKYIDFQRLFNPVPQNDIPN